MISGKAGKGLEPIPLRALDDRASALDTEITMHSAMKTELDNKNRGPAEIIKTFESLTPRPTKPRALFDYADALRQAGRCREALQIYGQLESASIPEAKRWLIFLYKGTTLGEIGRLAEAEQAFRESCRLDSSTVPRVYLAGTIATQERFQEAVQVLEEALLRESSMRRMDEEVDYLVEQLEPDL